MTPARLRTLVLAILLVGTGITLAAAAYRFRGAAPAILPPAGDIAATIEHAGSQPAPAINRTDFPLRLPDGFAISVFAKGFTKPRVLEDDPSGMLLLTDTGAGRIIGLPDDDHDGTADTPIVLAEHLRAPHGLALDCAGTACTLFVAETDAVSAYGYDAVVRALSDKRKILALPAGGEHTTRSLQLIGTADGKQLLTAIGSTCNACRETDSRRAAITISDLDGQHARPFATGLRNTVFMTADPATGKVWGADMGRDNLGDDLPPDEINILEDGGDYGWPFCYGTNVRDTVFDNATADPCATNRASQIDLPAHSAPLGIGFVPAAGWPDGWAHDLIVAYHGSWNRTEPTGYKLVRLELDDQNRLVAEHPFIDGWLQTASQTLGRPAGILVRSDGTLFVADDKAGLVYLVRYTAL